MSGLLFHFLARHLDFSAASCTNPTRTDPQDCQVCETKGGVQSGQLFRIKKSLCLWGQNDIAMSGGWLHSCPPVPTQLCHRPPQQWCAFWGLLETGFRSSYCQDFLLSDIRLKKFVCTPPASVRALIYNSFLSCDDFSALQHYPQNWTTHKSFCPSYLTQYTAAWIFLSNLALKMKVPGKYFFPRKLQFPQEVPLTSGTSLWMVNVRPTIQKNSCNILALPVAPIWDCQLW